MSVDHNAKSGSWPGIPLKVLGTGSGLPDRVLTNHDLEGMVDTSDAWIRERTGIKERRIADRSQATSDLCAAAIEDACRAAELETRALDAIIVATSTADTAFPSTACWTERKLGLLGMAAFDVSAGCSGFLYGLRLAASLLTSDMAERVAVVGGEVMSRVLNWNDRRTCVLFGDGAGAAIVTRGDGESRLLGSHWGADGTLAPVLYQPAGGSRMPATHATVDDAKHTVHMEGRTVFKHAVVAMADGASQVLERAGLAVGDVDLFIPHQANQRIMQATQERLGLTGEQVYSVLHKYGNMSAATIPVALDEARRRGRIAPGHHVLLSAFGTGFTWAAALLRW